MPRKTRVCLSLSSEPHCHQVSTTSKSLEATLIVIPPLPNRWSGEDPESISQQPHLVSQDNVIYQTRGSMKQQAEERRKQKLRHKYYMHQFHAAAYAVLLSVQKIHKKPKEIDADIHPLKWQRLQDLIKSLSSSIVLERKDAVKTPMLQRKQPASTTSPHNMAP
ncbi:protein HEATR9-like [Narcine bancroftii]|uniref:protein HEATR9-like n=1 Tax=Narcine bancroftii TaxID=1343680 RepID=UPI00383163DE